MPKRVKSHVIDTAGADLLRRKLPSEWVVRPYQPDYGIDFAIEVFDERENGLVTLGEQIFVQLKSHQRMAWKSRNVFARYNVEKGPLRYNKAESKSVEVLTENLSSGCLELARSMGPATPLVLISTNLETSEVHWVCLTDYVDKILIPEKGNCIDAQASHAIHLPRYNYIDCCEEALIPLRFLARRSKLYGAINRFRYQHHEVQYALERYRTGLPFDRDNDPAVFELCQHFLHTAQSYDFWSSTFAWPAMALVFDRLKELTAELDDFMEFEANGRHSEATVWTPQRSTTALLAERLTMLFGQVASLGNMLEEICREWYLPTYLGAVAEETAIREPRSPKADAGSSR